ncbi:MAG: TetR family transcriptional regulator C-terminal domain-containing protein [Desulfomonilaceae bacterium]
MAKQSTKEKIVAEGARIILKNGFNNTGVLDVLKAAGIPKGSFYFYFKSKEDFGLEVIEYFANTIRRVWIDPSARGACSPLEGLRKKFEDAVSYFQSAGCAGGCPIGNLAQEMGDLNENFRQRLEEVFREIGNSIAKSLAEAQTQGEIDRSLDVDQLAEFILNSWEGALLRMKTEKSIAPLLIFNRVVFGMLVRS